MTDDGDMFSHPELLTEIAIRAFARATKQAIEENDRLGIPSYGSKDGKIVVRNPPQPPDP
jgi:succinate dehydrogenase/fumarate reductase flavoprotein subunit